MAGEPLAGRRAGLTPAQRALLAKRLRSGAQGLAEEDPGMGPRPESGPAPASFGQRRLWHFAGRQPGNLAYNVYYAVRLSGTLDTAALAGSVRALIDRHEALRTRFEPRGGDLVAVAAPELVPAGLPLIDLAGVLDPGSRETEAWRAMTELAAPPFDLGRGPLLRTALVRTAAGDHSLLFAVHHAVIDGWSLALITRDLAAAYEALAAGRPVSWAAAPLQSGDFAHWQRRQVREGSLAGDLAWWRGYLAGAPAKGLSWSARPPAPGGRTARRLEPDTVQRLKALAQGERVTPFVVLLAGLDALLHHWTGKTDLIVGTPLALRGRPEAGSIVGFLLNVLPLRTDLSGDPTFLELLHRARDAFLGALAHREPPIEWLAEELLPGRDPGALPWVQVLFNMPSGETGHSDPLRVHGVELQPLLTGEMASEIDLTFYARELEGGIRLGLGYNANVLAPGEPARLIGGFRALVAAAVARPGQRLSELAGALLSTAGVEAEG
ncbi:MAG TPA: condensation domain-containing protein [Thermoanaerobaculia bacterium]|nr:condensation domain-containing protein [Thermoanaerobaculia bacterium]